MLTLGQQLRIHRERHGWSQSELSRRSGVPQPSISRIEGGARLQPRVHLVARLARTLGIPVEGLLVAWLYDDAPITTTGFPNSSMH